MPMVVCGVLGVFGMRAWIDRPAGVQHHAVLLRSSNKEAGGGVADHGVAIGNLLQQANLVVAEERRIAGAASLGATATTPVVVQRTGNVPTIVLTRRAQAYSVDALARQFPDFVQRSGPSTVLVRASLLVLAGARLDLTAPSAETLRLYTGPAGFASIVADGGDLEVGAAGGPSARIAITSWDPNTGQPSPGVDRGRAYLLDLRGRMDLVGTDVARLGFGSGLTSGVAWYGTNGVPATGSALRSTFDDSLFGAYTFGARRLLFVGDHFDDNLVYGLDLHDFTTQVLVVDSTADGNGRSGFVASRGCSAVDLVDSVADADRRDGVTLDDGRVADDGNPRHRIGYPSTDVVIDHVVTRSDGVGIVVQSSNHVLVENTTTSRNQIGVRLTGTVFATTITRSRVDDNVQAGVWAYGGPHGNIVRDTTIDSAPTGSSRALEADGPGVVAMEGGTVRGAVLGVPASELHGVTVESPGNPLAALVAAPGAIVYGSLLALLAVVRLAIRRRRAPKPALDRSATDEHDSWTVSLAATRPDDVIRADEFRPGATTLRAAPVAAAAPNDEVLVHEVLWGSGHVETSRVLADDEVYAGAGTPG